MDSGPTSRETFRTYRNLTIASAAILLSFTLVLPLSWDNEIYQSMATELLRYGRLPYLGSWDQNFPGIVPIHAVSVLLFGNSALGFHLFDILIHIAMSWMLFQILARWLNPRVAWIATLIYNIRYIAGRFWLVGQRDPFAIFFILLTVMALFAIERENKSAPRKMLYAGWASIAFSMAVMIRPTYLLFLLAGAIWIWTNPETKKQLLTGFVAGSALVFGSVILIYSLQARGLQEFYLATFRYNLDIYGPIHLSAAKIFSSVRTQKFYLGFGFFGIIAASFANREKYRSIGMFRTASRQDVILIAGIALSGLISLVVMGKYMLYHFEPLMLVLIPFSAIGIEAFAGLFSRAMYRYAAMSAIILFVMFRIAPFSDYYPALLSIMRGNPNAIAKAQDAMVLEPGFRISVEKAVAEYVDSSTPAGASVECLTLTAGIRWRLSHPCVSRYTTFCALSMATPDGHHPDFQQTWRKNYVELLQQTKPYYLIVGNGPAELLDWVHFTPAQSIRAMPGFDSLVLPFYRYDTTIGGYTLWKRIN